MCVCVPPLQAMAGFLSPWFGSCYISCLLGRGGRTSPVGLCVGRFFSARLTPHRPPPPPATTFLSVSRTEFYLFGKWCWCENSFRENHLLLCSTEAQISEK